MLNDEMSRRLQTLSGFEPEDITPVPSPRFLQTLTDMAAPMPGYMSPSGVDTSDTSIPGPHGDVGVRIYEPTAPETSPAAALVWCHGGAFIGGDLDMPEADCVSRELAGARAGNVLIDLRQQLDIALLFISHDLAVTRQVADSCAVMHRGRIVEEGSIGQVLDSPQAEYTQQLIEAIPRPGWTPRRRAQRTVTQSSIAG